MKFYNRTDYERVKGVMVNGKSHVSCYNHNYYRNVKTGDIVLEECDDDGLFDYYRVNLDGTTTALGCIRCECGIFGVGKLFPSDAPVEEDGSVELYDY